MQTHRVTLLSSEKFAGTDMIVAKSGLYGVIDTDGKVIIDTIYDDILRQGSYYIVKKQGLYGVLDKNGKVVINLTNDELHELRAIKAYGSKSAYFAKNKVNMAFMTIKAVLSCLLNMITLVN